MFRNTVHQLAVKLSAGFCIFHLSLVVTCVVLVGCGGDPDLADVKGVITLDGKPLPDAFVQFTPDANGATSYGKTDAKGSYRMKFSNSAYGAFIGDSRVSIRTGDVKPDNSGRIPELVPKIYNSESTLRANVVAGSNTFDFELDSKAAKIEKVQYD